MNSRNKAYNKIRKFVDEFANSSISSDSIPCVIENKNPWYAEWDENYMGALLNNYLIKKLLRKIADSYYGKQLDGLMLEATALTNNTYPRLYEVFDFCCSTLGMHNQPVAYVTGRMKGINGLSLEVRGHQFILISPRVATHLASEEQAFLLGHEISHHQQGNLVCHTVNGLIETLGNASEIFGPLVIDTIEVPLKRWCRCSEFNADRAGYLCCKDLEAIERLFLRLGMMADHSAYADYREIGAAHPLLRTRWQALNNYIHQNIG